MQVLFIILDYQHVSAPTEYNMDETIDLRLFATLGAYAPENASRFPIRKAMTIGQLIDCLPIAANDAKLIFVNGVHAGLHTKLYGGERVGIFPPIGGG
jgi:molybdopterin converting factor small subunit